MEDKGVSIVIAVCNLLGFTRLCIDYIRKNTVMPYELVIVDNGSSDGTQEYFEELSKELDVQYIRNETNLGVIAAVNQGARAARRGAFRRSESTGRHRSAGGTGVYPLFYHSYLGKRCRDWKQRESQTDRRV